jgi:hypothetical protein
VCLECARTLQRGSVPRCSLVRFDIGTVDLPPLTFVERQIVALLRVQHATVFIGGKRAPPGSRMRAARGNAVLRIAPGPAATLKVFPLPPATLPETITVVITDCVHTREEARARLEQLPALHVRGPVVIQWLRYLVPRYLTVGWVQPADAADDDGGAVARRRGWTPTPCASSSRSLACQTRSSPPR